MHNNGSICSMLTLYQCSELYLLADGLTAVRWKQMQVAVRYVRTQHPAVPVRTPVL